MCRAVTKLASKVGHPGCVKLIAAVSLTAAVAVGVSGNIPARWTELRGEFAVEASATLSSIQAPLGFEECAIGRLVSV